MIIEQDIKLDFKDVLIKPKRSPVQSRKDVTLRRAFKFKYSERSFDAIPIIASNMDTIGTIDMCETLQELGLVTALHKHLPYEDIDTLLQKADNKYQSNQIFCSMGISDDDYEKFSQIYACNRYANVCIDVANGYSEQFADFVAKVRKRFPRIIIMAGNVVTSEMTEQLILSGADIVKVGIGSGSVCTTRTQTGVGYPQLSAIIECADAAHGLGGLVCADGGCTVPGDVSKAFGAGADFVMLGGMLAGHDQCGGEIEGGSTTLKYITNMPTTFDKDWTGFDIRHDGTEDGPIVTTITENVHDTIRTLHYMQRTQESCQIQHSLVRKYPELFDIDSDGAVMKFYGMASKTAMDKYHGGVADYRSSEGKTVLVPYHGDVRDTVRDILGGVRSACSYVGASELKHLSKCTTFIRVTQQVNNIFS